MQLKTIELKAIKPNPNQPRRHFDADALQELAASIKERGVLQPILVEQSIDGYILHAGERRVRAAEMVGLMVVPAQVLPPMNGTGTRERIINAFAENVLREDMTPTEEARAIYELRKLGLTNTDISLKTGVNINTIAHRLLILDLDKELQELIAIGHLPRDGRAIKALLSIADKETRNKLGKRLARPGVTINTIVATCQRLNEKLSLQQAATGNKAPMIALTDVSKAKGEPVKWRNVRASAQAMCDKCDVKASLPDVPEPAWSIIVSTAQAVCADCSLRPMAGVNLDVCRDCPGVDLLKRLVAHA